jgi:hypothetical protein
MVDWKKAAWFSVGALLLSGLLALQQAGAPVAAQEAASSPGSDAAGGGGLGGGAPAAESRPSSPLSAKIPETIEGLLEQALRSNPEVIVAEAKVREAQAELNQARLKVTLQVLSFHSQKLHQQTAVDVAARYADVVKQRVGTGTLTQEEFHKALLAKVEAESALSQSEAQIRYLLGLGGDLRLEPPKPDAAAAPAVPKPRMQRPPIPERFKEFLQTQVDLQVGEPKPLREVLGMLRQMGGEKANFVLDREVDWDEVMVQLEAKEISMESALLMIHDLCRMDFVFRDYGILVTNLGSLYPTSPTIPADLPTDGE